MSRTLYRAADCFTELLSCGGRAACLAYGPSQDEQLQISTSRGRDTIAGGADRPDETMRPPAAGSLSLDDSIGKEERSEVKVHCDVCMCMMDWVCYPRNGERGGQGTYFYTIASRGGPHKTVRELGTADLGKRGILIA